jgi:hypothetical protein
MDNLINNDLCNAVKNNDIYKIIDLFNSIDKQLFYKTLYILIPKSININLLQQLNQTNILNYYINESINKSNFATLTCLLSYDFLYDKIFYQIYENYTNNNHISLSVIRFTFINNNYNFFHKLFDLADRDNIRVFYDYDQDDNDIGNILFHIILVETINDLDGYDKNEIFNVIYKYYIKHNEIVIDYIKPAFKKQDYKFIIDTYKLNKELKQLEYFDEYILDSITEVNIVHNELFKYFYELKLFNKDIISDIIYKTDDYNIIKQILDDKVLNIDEIIKIVFKNILLEDNHYNDIEEDYIINKNIIHILKYLIDNHMNVEEYINMIFDDRHISYLLKILLNVSYNDEINLMIYNKLNNILLDSDNIVIFIIKNIYNKKLFRLEDNRILDYLNNKMIISVDVIKYINMLDDKIITKYENIKDYNDKIKEYIKEMDKNIEIIPLDILKEIYNYMI